MVSIFRVLVSLTIIIQVLIYVFAFIQFPSVNAEEIRVLGWNKYGASITFPYWFWTAVAIFWVFVSIRMLYFDKWTRITYLWLVILVTLLAPFMGLYVRTGVDLFLDQAITLLDGAVLVFCYFTSISQNFNETKTSN